MIATIVPMRFSERTMELYRQGRVNLPTLPKGKCIQLPPDRGRGRDRGHPPRGPWRLTAYFDTSALLKLVLREPESGFVAGRWDAADDAYASTVGYVELHAAVARARRDGRVTERQPAACARMSKACGGGS